MLATVKTIIKYLEDLAPPYLAAEWDNTGLQIGDPEAQIAIALVALDLGRDGLTEVLQRKAQMVVTHHPLWLQPPLNINESLPQGSLIADIIRNKINVYSLHTNLDIVLVNALLADLVGLSQIDREVIDIASEDKLLKLVVYVPEGYEERIREALAEAGAGCIGCYSHCAFQVRGLGMFKPLGDATPFIGQPGRLEKVPEFRLETVLPESISERTVAALIAAHPYEEVAYDLYPLQRPGKQRGYGLLGRLDPPLTMEKILERCSEKLGAPGLRYWQPEGKVPRRFRRVAVGSGSGGSLADPAAQKGAELLITGDIKYHDLLTAAAYGMSLIDAGHFWTEWPLVEYLADYLGRRLREDRYRTAIIKAGKDMTINWRFYGGR